MAIGVSRPCLQRLAWQQKGGKIKRRSKAVVQASPFDSATQNHFWFFYQKGEDNE